MTLLRLPLAILCMAAAIACYLIPSKTPSLCFIALALVAAAIALVGA